MGDPTSADGEEAQEESAGRVGVSVELAPSCLYFSLPAQFVLSSRKAFRLQHQWIAQLHPNLRISQHFCLHHLLRVLHIRSAVSTNATHWASSISFHLEKLAQHLIFSFCSDCLT